MYRRRASQEYSFTEANARYGPSQQQRATERSETAKTVLPPSWEGVYTIGETSPNPQTSSCPNFTMGLFAVNPESQFRGIIFRNSKPIEEIKPFGLYGANKDALRSLQSLDQRLSKEYFGNDLSDSKSCNGSTFELDNQQFQNRSTSTLEKQHITKYPNVIYSEQQQHVQQRKWQQQWLQQQQQQQQTRNDKSPYSMNSIGDELDIVSLSPENKHDAMSLDSSSYLDLSDLESSLNQSRQSRLSFYANLHRASFADDSYSAHGNRSTFADDSFSLASSSASLAFGLRDYRSRRELNYADEELMEISSLVKHVSNNEGHQRNHKFQAAFQGICDVVNAITQEIPASAFLFRFKKVEMTTGYETTGINSYEIYLIPNIPKQDLEVCFSSKDASKASVFLKRGFSGASSSHRGGPNVDSFCVEDELTNRKKLSPCKLMIILSHIFNTSVKVGHKSFPGGAQVSIDDISEKGVQLRIRFPFSSTQYKVLLLLALEIDGFPLSNTLLQHRGWPPHDVKKEVISSGVHLTARLCDSDIHLWKVTFLKPRQALLQGTDKTGNKLRLLLVLQCLRETYLSQTDVVLPSHLATILFWASIKYRAPAEWSNTMLGKRFLDLVVALRRCLWKRECADFFMPNVNLFSKISRNDSYELLLKIDRIVKDPLTFLKSRIT